MQHSHSESRIKNDRNYPPGGSSVYQKIKTAAGVAAALGLVEIQALSSTLNGDKKN